MNNSMTEADWDVPIETVLEKWPKVSQVFISNRMSCIGCPFSKFHTLQDAREIYQLDKRVIFRQMQEAIGLKS
jgi:hybrid cluster-associated redox disulfide protein